MCLLFFEIYKRAFLCAGIVSLSKQFTHYVPRLCYVFNIVICNTGDALSSSVRLTRVILGQYLVKELCTEKPVSYKKSLKIPKG